MQVATHTKQRRWPRRMLLITTIAILALAGAVISGAFAVSEHLGNNVQRIPNVFAGLTERPAAAPQGTVTYLLAGSDSRSPDPTTGSDASGTAFVRGAQRSDALMIAQLSPDRQSAAVVSIPRDSWVDVPGHGKNKINDAFSLGGPSLMVQTVENLTHVHIDHFAVIDFAGFQSVVDDLGGIDLTLATASTSQGVHFKAGVNHLDGEQALAYLRVRLGQPSGDVTQSQRQQNVLRAVLTKLTQSATVSNPLGLYNFLDAATRSVSVDDTLTNNGLRGLAMDLRDLRPAGVTFLDAPIAGLGQEGQTVVYLDPARSAALWTALQNGNVTAYAAANPGDLLGTTPL